MAISITVRFSRSPIVPAQQAYDLEVEVLSAIDMPKEIFVMHRKVQPYDLPADDLPADTDSFQCLADPQDLEEFPINSPDLENEMPYYRVKKITLSFRDLEALAETKILLDEDIQALVNSLKAQATVTPLEEKTYA